MTTNDKKEKSNCCNAEITAISSDEGTGYFVCKKCGHACDIASPDTILEGILKELENKFPSLFLLNPKTHKMFRDFTQYAYFQGKEVGNKEGVERRWRKYDEVIRFVDEKVKEKATEIENKMTSDQKELLKNACEKVRQAEREEVVKWMKYRLPDMSDSSHFERSEFFRGQTDAYSSILKDFLKKFPSALSSLTKKG